MLGSSQLLFVKYGNAYDQAQYDCNYSNDNSGGVCVFFFDTIDQKELPSANTVGKYSLHFGSKPIR